MSSSSKAYKGNYLAMKETPYRKPGGKDGIHLNNLWSIWYGIICAILQGYLAYRSLKEILGYSVLIWPDGLPYLELNCSLGLNGAVFLLLPIFFTVTMLKIGNLANDGYKLGRQSSMCSREPADPITTNGGCGLFRYGGPTAPFIHIAIAFCLLVPKLLMEAKMIQAGFLSQDYIWHTDLDFMVPRKNRSVVLNFVQPANESAKILAQKFYEPLNFSNVTHTVIKTLKDIIGHKTRSYEAKVASSDSPWDSSISLEYVNLVIALAIYSVRYPAIFWSSNKSLGLLFSYLLFVNGCHIALVFAGVSILYKIHVTHFWTTMSFSQPRFYHFSELTPFLLNAEVTFGLYVLSVLLVLASSVVMYFYGHTRFTAFINHQRDKKLITLQGTTSNAWTYFTYCAAFCVLISIGTAHAPLVHDFFVVYRSCGDELSIACAAYMIFHLVFWICIWIFLTFKKKWTFKIRVSIGEAVIRESRSLRLIHSVYLKNNQSPDDPVAQQPLLIIGNGRTYTVSDTSPKRTIMDVIHKTTLINKSKSNGSMALSEDMGEDIYWLRPAADDSPQSSKGGKYFRWLKRRSKQKAIFDDHPSTSVNRATVRNSVIPGIDEDDGDYATLRELPLPPASVKLPSLDDNVSEEGKLLACVHDENITYASTSQDFAPPTAYQNHGLLEPIAIHTEAVHHTSVASSARLVRADSGILAHEELTGRSDSLSTECSVSPPEPMGSSHSESSSGVHSSESNDTSVIKQRTTSVASSESTSEQDPKSTVVIRRKSLRPNPNEGVAEAILKEDPYSRTTNMRMTSFMDMKGQSSSATLPHYPTQPTVQNMYNNCSTMPLPQHTSGSIPQAMTNGNSCNVYPNRPHTTIPTHLNGVKIVTGGNVIGHVQEMTNGIGKLEPIYTKINRATNELCHYSTTKYP